MKLRAYMNTLLFLFLVVVAMLVVASCSRNLGKPLGGDAPYHHLENGFRNPAGSPERGSSFGERMSFFSTMIWDSLTRPAPALGRDYVVPPDEARQQFAALRDTDMITWIGHATFFIRLGDVTILTDPVFSQRASPVRFAGPERFVPPTPSLADLPQIDVVIVSHAHYEHLDTATLDALPNRERITAIVPLGLGVYFTTRGFGAVHEVDWYDEVKLADKDFRLTAYPAVHWSNRSPFDRNRALWMSYGFSSAGRSVFHSGDTENHPTLFQEVGVHMARQYGGCDIGLLSVGAYEPRAIMRGAHATPEGMVDIGTKLGCKRMIPMHWSTFRLSTEPFAAPRTRFMAAAGNQGLVMKIGESLRFDDIF